MTCRNIIAIGVAEWLSLSTRCRYSGVLATWVFYIDAGQRVTRRPLSQPIQSALAAGAGPVRDGGGFPRPAEPPASRIPNRMVWCNSGMKRTIAAVAVPIALLLASCSSNEHDTTETPEATAQDSGVLGIVVPGSATPNDAINTPGSAGFVVDGMTFEEATQWMGQRLPTDETVDGMELCAAERVGTIHQWVWVGEQTTDGWPMLSVRVMDSADAPEILVSSVPDDPAGC